jgi:hypothetical protein
MNQMPPLVIYIPKNTNRKFFPEHADDLRNQFAHACGTRRIYYLVLETWEEVKSLSEKPWAIIDLGENPLPFSKHEIKKISQVHFREGDNHLNALVIGWAQWPLTIHQVNRVLDLLIDGESGLWIFDSGGIIFKSMERMSANYYT